VRSYAVVCVLFHACMHSHVQASIWCLQLHVPSCACTCSLVGMVCLIACVHTCVFARMLTYACAHERACVFALSLLILLALCPSLLLSIDCFPRNWNALTSPHTMHCGVLLLSALVPMQGSILCCRAPFPTQSTVAMQVQSLHALL